jgi:hypothetical protein
MKTFEEFLTEATLKLNKENLVSFDRDSEAFAKEYVVANKGDYTSGGGNSKDEKAAEMFYTKYDSKETRKGFAGSGITVFTDKESGDEYQVTISPNGKGFSGSDHSIRKM